MSSVNSVKRKDFGAMISSKAKVFNESLKEIVKPTFKGLETPKSYKSQIELLSNLKRKPFPRQARTIAAGNEHLTQKDALILSAEMGTGKTIMGIATAYLQFLAGGSKPMTSVIMCPTHLVSKWAKEIEDTLGKKIEASCAYQIVIVKKYTDLIGYKDRVLDNKLYFFIFSKETAKLSYPRKETVIPKSKMFRKEKEQDGELHVVKTIGHIDTCPDCGAEVEKERETSKHLPQKCKNCNTPLRSVDKEKSSADRLSIAEYIKKQFPKQWIDLLILDEIHELKGGDTAQGNSFGVIASRAKKCLGLTGTLLNGYASSLFYILYRLNPRLMKETLRLEYKDVERFVDLYGAKETQYDSKEEAVEGMVTKKGRKINVKELPKINPMLLPLILPMTIFLRLDEMNIKLPDYEEFVELVEPDEEWVGDYRSYINDLAEQILQDKRVLGSFATDSIAVPDLPYMHFAPKYGKIGLAYTPSVDEDFITSKEKRLIEMVINELEEGRKVLLFATYTNMGLSERLKTVLENNISSSYNIKTLPASVNASKREKWIKDNPCDILICNPELVKTGLDLLEYPTIIFFQTTYNVFTLKQAMRRSWRIGQDKNIKVYFMAYDDTAQRKALALISKKIGAANSLEGRLSLGDDLAGLEEDNSSMQQQLAKSIQQGGMNSKDEVHTSKWSFEEREWDQFESYYLSVKDSLEERVAIMEEEEKDEKAQQRARVAKEIVKSNAEKLDSQEVKNQEEKEVSSTPTTIQPSLFPNEDGKITIFRRVKRGKKWVEEAMEATATEIQVMVEEEGAPIQLTLF